VLENLFFGLRNEHAEPAGGNIKKSAAMHATVKGKLQKGVGGVRFHVSSVLVAPVLQLLVHRSVPSRFLLSYRKFA